MSQPVVIVGGGINGLGVARSIDSSFDSHIIDSNPHCAAAWSRHAKFTLVKSTKDRQLIDELIQLRKQFHQNPVLIITEEKAVFNISQYRQELATHFQFLMPNHQLVDQLLDKDAFYELALEHDAPVPKTLTINSIEDLAAADSLTFPCVFKPHEQNAAYAASFKKAYKVFSVAEVSDLYQKISSTLSTMILQEWIEGEDSDIYFTLSYIGKSGNVLSAFTGRKLRSWPINVGGTASCTNAPEVAAELEEISHEFCRKINYQGLIGIEYKRNKPDGRFLIIEPTVSRTDFQHEIAFLSGCRLLDTLVADAGGQEMPIGEVSSKPVVWKEALSEAMAIEQSGDGGYPVGAVVYSALFRVTDPMPYLAWFFRRIKRKFFG